ncbi:MAG: hypothetical protein ACFFC6_14490 [Promethearchaeota archaeon]
MIEIGKICKNLFVGIISILIILIGVHNLYFGDGLWGFVFLGFGIIGILGRILYGDADDPHGLVFGRRFQ